MASTYFADMLTFRLRGSGEVVKCEPPLVLGSEPDKPFAESPLLFWRHDVALGDKDVQVLAYAGSTPVLAKAVAGKGQVFVFAGTVLGEPAAGAHAFWETAAWRDLWRQMCGAGGKQQ